MRLKHSEHRFNYQGRSGKSAAKNLIGFQDQPVVTGARGRGEVADADYLAECSRGFHRQGLPRSEGRFIAIQKSVASAGDRLERKHNSAGSGCERELEQVSSVARVCSGEVFAAICEAVAVEVRGRIGGGRGVQPVE